MTAPRALRMSTRQGIIELEGIDARVPVAADNLGDGRASQRHLRPRQQYDGPDQDITVTTTDGMVAKLKSAFLDMGKGTMKTDDPSIRLDGRRSRRIR